MIVYSNNNYDNEHQLKKMRAVDDAKTKYRTSNSGKVVKY